VRLKTKLDVTVVMVYVVFACQVTAPSANTLEKGKLHSNSSRQSE